jgi:hypothetical protein
MMASHPKLGIILEAKNINREKISWIDILKIKMIFRRIQMVLGNLTNFES